jgi:BlaI family penicillinase repressor
MSKYGLQVISKVGRELMPYREKITDAELDIMKVLWENGPMASPVLFKAIPNIEERNIGTLKTLLTRLVQKGAVRIEEINSRNYLYIPVITEEEYISKNRRRFIERVFDGSKQKLLLNFIKEESITREDLEELFKQLEGDERVEE